MWGDGSAGYSIAEFDTFARHGVPVIGLVGNDACWTQIEREQTPMFASDVACPLEYCSYDKVAQGCVFQMSGACRGGAGARVSPEGCLSRWRWGAKHALRMSGGACLFARARIVVIVVVADVVVIDVDVVVVVEFVACSQHALERV